MDFTFTEDQIMYRDRVADMLGKEVTADGIRDSWQSETGIDPSLRQQLVDMGLTAMLVPEKFGGLGLTDVDFILLAEECGKVALPEPLVDSSLVSTSMLASLAEGNDGTAARCGDLLAQIAEGSISVATGHWINPYINFAANADWLLLPYGNEMHLLAAEAVKFERQKSLDPSRRLYKIDWHPTKKTRVADGPAGAEQWRGALNRGALGTAAQLLGLAQAMVDLAVKYSCERQQFGNPIGKNQAVKHLMANCAVRVEFAKSVVHRSSYTTSLFPARADFAVSHAKVAAGQAALLSAKNGIQVHGAMGYTWECDFHIWMKRSWALEKSWGDAGFHKNRIHEWLLNPKALLGAENTFGKSKVLPADQVSQINQEVT